MQNAPKNNTSLLLIGERSCVFITVWPAVVDKNPTNPRPVHLEGAPNAQLLRIKPLLNIINMIANQRVEANSFFNFIDRVNSSGMVFSAQLMRDFWEA